MAASGNPLYFNNDLFEPLLRVMLTCIFQESGFGPSWMTHIRVTPFKIRLEYIVRTLSFLLP